jgi:hypothetical protein
MKPIVMVAGLALAAGAWAAPVHAELIKLKNGDQFEAKITKRMDRGVVVDWEGVSVTYWFSDIENIDGEPVAPAAASDSSGALVSGASPLRGQAPALEPVPPLAAEDEALIQETIKLSGLSTHLEELQAQTQEGFKGREDDERLKKLTPEQREEFLKILTDSFNPDQLRRDIENAFRRKFNRGHAQAAVAWLNTDLSRKMETLERQPRKREELELFVSQLEQDPPSPKRIELARRYLEASRAADAAIEMGVTVATSMARAMDAKGKLKAGEFKAGIEKAKQVYQEQYREQIEAAVMANFLFVYRTVPDEDLVTYVEFMESPSGQWLTGATIAALGEAMSGATITMSQRLIPMIEDAKRKEQKEPQGSPAPATP